MKLQIIEIKDYILAVSDEVREGDICLDGLEIFSPYETGDIAIDKFKKIIAYQPKNNAPELDLPLLPDIIIEDDVEKLVEKLFPVLQRSTTFGSKFPWTPYREREAFIAGHKAATKIYSEEDLKKAVEMARVTIEYPETETCFRFRISEIIQTLKQPKTPKWFVAEMKEVNSKDYHTEVDYRGYSNIDITYDLKTTTFNDKTYLIGTYLYE